MYRDRNIDLNNLQSWNEETILQDLELGRILETMGGGDDFIYDVSKKVMLHMENDKNTIMYRQAVLKDCIRNVPEVREIYNILVQCIKEEKEHYFWFSEGNPDFILHESIKVLQIFIRNLNEIRRISEANGNMFESDGFRSLFSVIKNELDQKYLSEVEEKLKMMLFPQGVPVSVRLGPGNEFVNYTLLDKKGKNSMLQSLISFGGSRKYNFTLADRDESGAQSIAQMRARAIEEISNILWESTENVLGFFEMLRNELAFYIGCINLYELITEKGEPICFPTPYPEGSRVFSFRGLYDISLSLSIPLRCVGNDMEADGKDLVIITGTNRGGKTTFLRSVGQAQIMMQCGMFAPAISFASEIRSGIFTHFRKEEDRKMVMGKLDEELNRMSSIVDHMDKYSMVLFNESFSGTNSREGSEIAKNIVTALIEAGIRVLFVSHMYEFSIHFYENMKENILFLWAERKPDGTHTYRIIEGDPLETSHSEDLYRAIFGEAGYEG